MTTPKITLGAAIDQMFSALSTLDSKEQQTAITTVCSHLGLSPNVLSALSAKAPTPAVAAAAERTPSTSAKSASHTGSESGLDIRTLKDQKQPDSARQMACIVAYYLLDHAPEAERKQAITSSDIEKFFKQAGYKLPAKLEQLLVDCKGSGYFEAISRGEYKLTRVGYNLVTHSLPKGSKG